MQCREVVDLYSELYDVSIDDSTKEVIKQHLCDCPQCCRNFDTFKATIDIVSSQYPKVSTSRNFEEMLWKRIKQPTRWERFVTFFRLPELELPNMAPALAMATAFIILIGSGFLLRDYIQPATVPADQAALTGQPAVTTHEGPALSTNPHAASVAISPARNYTMPTGISSASVQPVGSILLRGAGTRDWTDEADLSREFTLEHILSAQFRDDSLKTNFVLDQEQYRTPPTEVSF